MGQPSTPQPLHNKPVPFEIPMKPDNLLSGIIHIPFQNGRCFDQSNDPIIKKMVINPATPVETSQFDPTNMRPQKTNFYNLSRPPASGQKRDFLHTFIFKKYYNYIKNYFNSRGKIIEDGAVHRIASVIAQNVYRVLIQAAHEKRIRDYTYIKSLDKTFNVTYNPEINRNIIVNETFLLNDVREKNAVLKNLNLVSGINQKDIHLTEEIEKIGFLKQNCRIEADKTGLRSIENVMNHINSTNNKLLEMDDEDKKTIIQIKEILIKDTNQVTKDNDPNQIDLTVKYGTIRINEQKLTEKDFVFAMKMIDDVICKRLLYKYLFCSVDEKDKKSNGLPPNPPNPPMQQPSQMGYQMNRMGSPTAIPQPMNQMNSQMGSSQMSQPPLSMVNMNQSPISPIGMSKPPLNPINGSMSYSKMSQTQMNSSMGMSQPPPPLIPVKTGHSQMSPNMGMSKPPLTQVNLGQMQMGNSQFPQPKTMGSNMSMSQHQMGSGMGMQQQQMNLSRGMHQQQQMNLNMGMPQQQNSPNMGMQQQQQMNQSVGMSHNDWF